MRSVFKIIGIIVMVFGIVSVAFYSLYWTKTPTYSLKMIEESVQTNDIQTFKKYVDLHTLCEKSFYDILEIRYKQETINPFAYFYLLETRPKIRTVASLETRATNFIEGKSGGKTIVDSKDFFISKVSIEKKTDKMLLATIEFNDSPQGKLPIVTVKMVKLNDGRWQVKAITNWEDILSTLGEEQYEVLPEFPKHATYKNIKV